MICYLYIVSHLWNEALVFEHEAQMRRSRRAEHELDRAIALRRAHTAWCEIVWRAGGLG